MMGIMVPETCCASNKICNEKQLLHLVGILFPQIIIIIMFCYLNCSATSLIFKIHFAHSWSEESGTGGHIWHTQIQWRSCVTVCVRNVQNAMLPSICGSATLQVSVYSCDGICPVDRVYDSGPRPWIRSERRTATSEVTRSLKAPWKLGRIGQFFLLKCTVREIDGISKRTLAVRRRS